MTIALSGSPPKAPGFAGGYLLRWEISRLCRGGNKSLTFSEVRFTSLFIGFPKVVHAHVDGFWKLWLRSSPFEKRATIKPRALPENTYSLCLKRKRALHQDQQGAGDLAIGAFMEDR